MSVRLVCGSCGKIRFFASFDAALANGWDTVAVLGYNCCPNCPALTVYLPMLYAQQARGAGTEQERDRLLRLAAEATHGDFRPELN